MGFKESKIVEVKKYSDLQCGKSKRAKSIIFYVEWSV